MAVLNDSIVQGDLRVIGNLYANISGKSTSAVSAEKAVSATKALQDSYGTNINASSYKTKQTASAWTGGTTGKTITAIHQNANGDITAINTGNITIPTVNNATVTIQKNGTTVTSFKLNDSSATTANITVPTALSQITSAHTHATGDITNLTGITVAKAKDLENSAFYNHSGNIWSGVSATVQSEINNKIAGVYQIQGDAVWSAISANNDNKKNGYVYNITGGVDGNSKDRNNNVISIGDNVVYIASSNKASAGWDKLASTLNTSNFALKNGTYTAGDTKLSAYSAVTAAAVPWTGVTNRPGLFTSSSTGLVPSSNSTAKFLRGDATWQTVITSTANCVPTSRTVNGKALSANVTIGIGDISNLGTYTGYANDYNTNKNNLISGTSALVKAGNLSADSLNLNGDASVNTLNANEAVINGAARVLGTLYADTIEGKISSATSANNADTLDGKHAADFVLSSDSRLTDSRTPKAHATSATTYGVGTTANYGHVKIVNTNLNGSAHSDGIVAGLAHTHGQYLTAHQSLANYVTTGTNQTITGTKTFSSNNFLEALRVSRNNSAGGAAIGLYPCKQTVTGWGINAGGDGNLNIGKITNTTALDTTSSLFVSANGTVKATTFSGNLSGVARSALSATTAYVASSTIPINLHNGYKEYTWSSTNDDTWANFIKDASASTASFACKVFGSGLDTTEKTINAIGRLNLNACTGANSSAIKQNLVIDSYPMFHVVATRQVGYVEFYNNRRRVRYKFGRFGGLVTANYDNLYKTVVTSAFSAGSATTANVAKTLTATISASYSSLSAGSANLAGTATSATSSNWNNLINKPTIPAAQIQSNWTQTDTSKLDYIKNKPSFGTMTGANTTSYYLKTETSGKDQISAALNGKQVAGNYLSASYATATTSTFSGTAATAKNLYVNEHSTNDTTYYPIWANGAGNSNRGIYTTSAKLQFNPKSGQLYVSDKMKVGGCTMTWNASTSALDFTF